MTQNIINETENTTPNYKALYDDLIKQHTALKRKTKYGLVWEDKPEDLDNKDIIPLFKHRTDLSLNPTDQPMNYLIEGDNYHSLKVLQHTHRGKIGVIYIDPPYNTGNTDFVYNDKYVDSDDGFRHSKWLSFMDKRLRLARELLSNDGVIFVSIDDNEMAQLKLLMDKIFGADNYVNTIAVKAKSSSGASGGGEDRRMKKNIEYLLIYTKRFDHFRFNTVYQEKDLVAYKNERIQSGKSFAYNSVMMKPGTEQYVKTIKAGNGEDIDIYEMVNYEIKSVSAVCKDENLTETQVYTKYYKYIFTTENAQTSIRTRVKDAVGDNQKYYIARYKPVSGRNKNKLTDVGFIGNTKRLISYLYNVSEKSGNRVVKKDKVGTLWDDLSWANVLNEGGIPFNNGKKPISLIKRILEMHPNKSATVLDFFAGSGTTGHAVMELNKEDGGNRSFILCTNNEVSPEKERAYLHENNLIPKNNKTEYNKYKKEHPDDYKAFTESDAYQELGIAQAVTRERLKRVIEGYTTPKGKVVAGLPNNLTYLQTNEFPKAEVNSLRRKELANLALNSHILKYPESEFETFTVDLYFDINDVEVTPGKTPTFFVNLRDMKSYAEMQHEITSRFGNHVIIQRFEDYYDINHDK